MGMKDKAGQMQGQGKQKIEQAREKAGQHGQPQRGGQQGGQPQRGTQGGQPQRGPQSGRPQSGHRDTDEERFDGDYDA
ncbi:hypothetical protein [Streptomyces sp. NPDC002520]